MTQTLSDAERAGLEALETVQRCIDERQSFLLEAGAGAGKTYSLIHSLRYLIEREGDTLQRRGQQVACITYTNVARDEIESRTDGHPAVLSATIHSFCWSMIKRFQPVLREELPAIGKWAERIAEEGELGLRRIDYDLGYPSMKQPDTAMIGHDDVLALTVALTKRPKFRALLQDRYPVIFIDEYQDTDTKVADVLKTDFIDTRTGPLIGLFGDHWQKIYENGCGQISHPHLQTIDKHANFRSAGPVVEVLNRIRPELPQFSSRPNDEGFTKVYHSNQWTGQRRAKFPWNGDLPPGAAHAYLEAAKRTLEGEGWDFSSAGTKILMLTHNILADEQGYRELADVFSRNEMFIKKEDARIAFFADILEPACEAYEAGRIGEMFSLLGGKRPAIRSHKDKAEWTADMAELLKQRDTGTVGDVLDLLERTKHPRLPDSIEQAMRQLADLEGPEEEWPSSAVILKRLRGIPYVQVEKVVKFVNGSTPFSTKHGVKGAEFENVLVVVGRGWGNYDFNQMLEFTDTPIPANKQVAFERARNLFYVCCSRPRTRLAVLFTQQLSAHALSVLEKWFGGANVQSLTV